MEQKKEATKLTQRIISGTYGKEAQFFCEYTKTHLVTLESLVEPSGYDDLFRQFLKCSSDYIDRFKPSDATLPNTSELIELGPSTLTQKKKDKFLEKYRTPLCERTNFVVNKPSITVNEERLSLCESESSNAKKRSAFAADISSCLSAEDYQSEEDNDSIQLVKVKLFKEKKKTKKGETKLEEPEVVEQSLNPSKKIRLVDGLPDEPKTSKKSKKNKKIEEEIEEVSAKSSKKKTGKKKKTTKSKKVTEPEEDLNCTDLDAENIKEEKEATTQKKTKKTKKSKKTKESIASEDLEKEKTKKKNKTPVRIDNKTLKSVSKTPATNSTHRRMSRILLQSAIRNSTNKSRRPITRRAAAEAAKKEPINTKPVSKPVNPVISALKKAEGVPIKSPVKKLISKYENITNTPGSAAKNRRINFDKGTPTSISRVKTNNPIDDRKIRASLQRLEAKRKSTKKAQEFLAQNLSKKESLRLTDEKKKKLSNEDKEASNPPSTSSSQSNSGKDEAAPITPTKNLSVNILTEKDQNIVDSILKSGSPKLQISKIPVGIITGGQRTSVSAAAFLAEQKRRLTKDFETNPVPKAIIQNTITKLQTPSKPSSTYQIATAVTAATATAIKPIKSFANFLERNTPSKMSRTEMEDKKKAELLHKETKEKERLQEQERQKQEKRDESKRKREEKLRKINEVKQKKELELEQKRREMEQQKQTLPKITSSASNNSIMHKSVLNNTTNTHMKPMLIKKPIESAKQSVVVKKLSIAEQEIISDFANKFGKLKQIQNPQHESNDAKPANKPNYASEYETQSLTKLMHNHQQNLEQTYVLKSPPNSTLKPITNQLQTYQNTGFTNYEVTPLQPPKLKDIDNYDVSNLGSEDDTDDDEEPSKPIPSWATQQNLVQKVKQQNYSMVNFTRLFRSASQAEINLEKIFKTKRRKFTERSSSANWTCPPVWNGQGLTGDESFRTFRK